MSQDIIGTKIPVGQQQAVRDRRAANHIAKGTAFIDRSVRLNNSVSIKAAGKGVKSIQMMFIVRRMKLGILVMRNNGSESVKRIGSGNET